MSGNVPEESVSRPAVLQGWRSFLSLHWAYDASALEPFVPRGLALDTFDGSAWVSAALFLVKDSRPPGMRPLPWLSTFPQVNLRTYVRDERGRDGIWFLSLEVPRLALATFGRSATLLPYRWATIRASDDGTHVSYAARRLFPPADARMEVDASLGAKLTSSRATERDYFVTGRWRAFVPTLVGVTVVPVEHEPWTLHRARIDGLDQTLLAACGVPAPEHEPLALYSAGVNARMGFPRPARL